jgi:hypothetical protein
MNIEIEEMIGNKNRLDKYPALVNIIYRRYEFWKKIETTENKEGFDSAGVG